MATTSVAQAAEAVDRPRPTGWGRLGGLLLVVLGGLNVVNGFAALDHAGYFSRHILYANLTFWGSAFLFWGVLQVTAGGLVLGRRPGGRVMGAALAASSAILWFLLIFAAPQSAAIGALVSVLVLWCLTIGSPADR